MMIGWWGMGWMPWLWIFALFGCGWFFYWWRPLPFRRSRYRKSKENPLEVAKVRLARGEISLEEFEEIKRAVDP